MNLVLKKSFLALFALFMFLNLSADMLVTGKVAVGNLYVRAKPGKKYTKVATLSKDETVVVLEKQGTWLKILAPTDTETWLPSSTISKDKTNKSTYIYSGPSIGYTTLGTLGKETSVKIINTKSENWVKIATPAGTTAWVSADFVNIPNAIKATLITVPKD